MPKGVLVFVFWQNAHPVTKREGSLYYLWVICPMLRSRLLTELSWHRAGGLLRNTAPHAAPQRHGDIQVTGPTTQSSCDRQLPRSGESWCNLLKGHTVKGTSLISPLCHLATEISFFLFLAWLYLILIYQFNSCEHISQSNI